jgi:uncharacterized membrane protein YbhN (UPF0104 family)
VLSKSTKIILNYTFGIGLFAWFSYSIYYQLRYKSDLQGSIRQLKESIVVHWPAILIVLAMMLINWGIEARKWQILVSPLEKMSFRKAFYAVLSGVSFSVNTPNRIGEYGGRILYLRNTNRIRAITVTIVGSFGQFITTLLFGIGGLIYYMLHFEPVSAVKILTPYFWEKAVLCSVLILTAIVITLYFRLHVIVGLFSRIKWLRRLRKYVLIIHEFSNLILLKILLLSIVRYLVFSAQYLILLKTMGVEITWWQGFMIIFLIYLVMALLPTIAIAELGIRGEVGLYFLGLISTNKIGIIAGTIGIWLINLIIPAIIGSLLLLGIKVLNEEKVTGILEKQRA